MSAMQILQHPISRTELTDIARNTFGDMVKAVADVKKGLLALDADLHADLEQMLLEEGSAQENLWGFNLWVEEEAGKESRAQSAFARFQELIDLTIRYGRMGESKSARSAMWKELCRFRELYCAAFQEHNLPELVAANRYLDQFASIR